MSDEEDQHLGADDEQPEEEANAEGTPPPEEPAAVVTLTNEDISANLSLLSKVGNGLEHAFVKVDLHSKQFTDISALSTFKHVRYVDISENALSAVSSLESLSELVTLNASKNKLAEFKLSPHRYLQQVDLSDNALTSCNGITHPLLRSLKLARNQLSDVSGLLPNGVPSLASLDLVGNKIASLSSLAALASLTELYLASNGLNSLEGLSSLVNLKRLHARDNAIASLNGISASLKHLEYINLRQNSVASVAEAVKLAVLPSIRAIVLSDNPVTEASEYRMEMLVAIRNLQRLDKNAFEEEEQNEAADIAAKRAAEKAAAKIDA